MNGCIFSAKNTFHGGGKIKRGQQRPLFMFWNLKKRPLLPLKQVLTAGGEWLYFLPEMKIGESNSTLRLPFSILINFVQLIRYWFSYDYSPKRH